MDFAAAEVFGGASSSESKENADYRAVLRSSSSSISFKRAGLFILIICAMGKGYGFIGGLCTYGLGICAFVYTCTVC